MCCPDISTSLHPLLWKKYLAMDQCHYVQLVRVINIGKMRLRTSARKTHENIKKVR